MRMKDITLERTDRDTIKLRFDNGTKKCFSATGEKIGEIPILKDGSKNVFSILLENKEKMEHISKLYYTDKILACSNVFLATLVREDTSIYDIDINVFISKDRNIVYYIPYCLEEHGRIITLLLVSCDH